MLGLQLATKRYLLCVRDAVVAEQLLQNAEAAFRAGGVRSQIRCQGTGQACLVEQ